MKTEDSTPAISCIPIQRLQSKRKQLCLCPYSQQESENQAFWRFEHFDGNFILILGLPLENIQQWERLHLLKPQQSMPLIFLSKPLLLPSPKRKASYQNLWWNHSDKHELSFGLLHSYTRNMSLNVSAGMKKVTCYLLQLFLGLVEKAKAFKCTLLLFEFTSR